jgi:hypothetical protein
LSLFRRVLPRWKRNGSKRSEAFSEEQAVIDPIEGQRAEDNREAENASFLKKFYICKHLNAKKTATGTTLYQLLHF